MTVIRPNAIAGITSLTAQADNITFHKSDGTTAGLLLNGVNFNTTSGVSTFATVNATSVGIGTDTISSLLQIRTASTGANMLLLEADLGTNNNRSLSVASPAIDSTTDPFVVNTGNSLQLKVDSTLGLHIHQDASVGIGTDNPRTKLDVRGGDWANGDIVVGEKDNAGRIKFARGADGSDTGSIGFVAADNNSVLSMNVASGDGVLTFQTNSTERLRITSTGLVGIGTSIPTSTLHVTGDVLVTGIGTAVQWDATSDIALKENIEVIDNPIVKLSELKGVTFDWKFGGHSVGVIAQDVEKVLPTAVGGSEDRKTVNYNAIIGLLVESVKDQQKQIEELKSLLDK